MTAAEDLTLSKFGEAVPHVELATCPAGMESEEHVCALMLANSGLHVWVVEAEGVERLFSVTSYYGDDMFKLPFRAARPVVPPPLTLGAYADEKPGSGE